MTADIRLAGAGTALLLVSSALLMQTAIDSRLPVLLAALATLGAIAAVLRVAEPTA
ncbi:hypothetical protein [Haloferax larsenii]|uniref:Uncharacterized protein n=1 Tax=Haloferax larsenii TaxID=302484 RepID=A0A1H7I196_HALLR|nr:hypothetical protein [Haloferax larsenii]UVE49298.1 hypothetical protein KU306_10210 [Haloferax larsenii]SEK56373.1 hypothetical protein SAMN04488691_101757 [Haloferax larsenii]